jgi:two-component system, chemotaxis family, sensor kinase CheA
MSHEIDRDELLRIFLTEAEEILASLEQMLVLLETKPKNEKEIIDEIFRGAHTLKGNAASLGFDSLTRLAHAMEGLLDEARDGRFPVTSGFVTLLLRSGDTFRKLIPHALDAKRETGAGALPPEAVRVIESLEQAKETGTVAGDAGSIPVESDAVELSSASGRRLRVDLDLLDVILDLTSELSIATGRLFDGLASLGERERERLLSSYVDVERILTDLQEQVTKVRMVPVGPRFEQQRRAIRDLAQAAGKPVRLAIEGRDVELDASLVQQLKDPLTHMIRNAVDHAIEAPGVRRTRGKDPVGTITLAARQDGGSVFVQVCDDGAGFDRERILARGRERGMVAANATLTDDEIHALVFAPGFSTAETVTEISGRGVGMDIVARAVAAMRGTVHVDSRPGVGTTITMRLPLTLAMLGGLVVDAAGERFVVPIHSITQCLAVPTEETRARVSGLLDIGGRVLPYVRLRRFFALEAAVEPRVEQMVVVESDGLAVGLVADDLIGEMQAVIKPLGQVFRNLAGVSASTIFPDGRVGLILDVSALVRRAAKERAA